MSDVMTNEILTRGVCKWPWFATRAPVTQFATWRLGATWGFRILVSNQSEAKLLQQACRPCLKFLAT